MKTSSKLCLIACLAALCLSSGCRAPEGASPGGADPTSIAGGASPELPPGDAVPKESSSEDMQPDGQPTRITIGLPYRPDVQFTPLYVAQASGLFSERGLEVTFQYGDEAQFVRLVGKGDMDASIASGEQIIMARAAGIPVKYVMTWYQRFAGVVFSLDPDLDTPESLVGHSVGLPALSGASYIGWQALLADNGIDPKSVATEVVGYQQLPSVLNGRVDAAVGYAANEPVQLRAEGHDVSVIDIADYFNLVSNGLVLSDDTIAGRPDASAALVEAVVQAIEDSLAHPDDAFAIALQYVPEAADESVRDRQRQVLAASMAYWTAAPDGAEGQGSVGVIDQEAWARSQDFLIEIGLVEEASAISDLVDDRFVAAALAPGRSEEPQP